MIYVDLLVIIDWKIGKHRKTSNLAVCSPLPIADFVVLNKKTVKDD